MDPNTFDQTDHERVKKIRVKEYQHHEAGFDLRLKQMSLYLLNEDDFAIHPDQFDPSKHEHSIPKYEMARIYLLICALTQDELGFSAEERDDPVFHIYEKAYHRCLELETDAGLLARLERVARSCGFTKIAH